MARKFLIAVTLANLCFFPAWREILDPASDSYFYFMKTYPRWVELLAITCNILLLTALCLPLVFLALGRGRRRLALPARLLLLSVVLVPLNAFRIQFDALDFPNLERKVGRPGLLLLGLSLLLVAAVALLRLGVEKITRAVASALLVISPFTFIAYAQGIWVAAKYEDAVEGQTPGAARLHAGQARATRVLWLIFDELDERLLFAARPPGFEAPEFDRLRGESLSAANAYPPAGFTKLSLPALTVGRLVAKGDPVGPGELAIQLHGSEERVGWSTLPNVFSRAREGGYNTAVVGWYHPYCRLLGASLTRCFWESPSDPAETQTFSYLLLQQAKSSFLSVPLLHLLVPNRLKAARSSLAVGAYKNAHVSLLREALKVVADPELDLVLVHMLPPHPPNFYNRASGQFAVGRKNSYLDSLALADRSFGEIRAAMEQAGVWDTTSVLVSGDHWWRASKRYHPAGKKGDAPNWSEEDTKVMPSKPDERVPFLLKLARHSEGAVYDQPFNTILSADLLLAILRGEVSDPGGAARWLDANKTIAKSPYYDLGGPTDKSPLPGQ